MTQTARRSNVPKAYDPQAVERRIYDKWIDSGHFTPEIDRDKEPFVIIMPPPNVTGELHMGHALTKALEDLMIRWHRMKGDPTLYLPGSDHAGIATQVVVERALASDGITRHDLGREKFVERVWQWVDQYGDRIYEQIKRLGASCDWTRTAFTLDAGPAKAVRKTFVSLYKKGLIYRGERITNWCPRCRTALSDLEVKHREEDGRLYDIRYDLEGGGSVTIATTRPETLLGDTAVAVNPEDDRASHLVGRTAVLPVLARHLPIVADEAVELGFGTGALKVTPGHDPNDFEIGARHDLPTVNILNLDGTLNGNAGPYEGQDRMVARGNIVAQLEAEGKLVGSEPHRHSVGHCDRCDEIVEPIISRQWYVRMEPLARPARDRVADGSIRIVPERFTRVYFNWMDNIRDWCISRQLWWGHRIPVWYCGGCEAVIVEEEDPTACPDCGSADLERDPDVLDTWFSSGLWPHSTLGWPDETEDLDYFYPGSVLETGYDILFFWVARMIVLGIENMGDVPFRTVYLHGLVVDPEGLKMSKSRGNVVDPLELINMYGADALRFALTTGNSPGNDMRLNQGKLEASRNFANKLWNAARFAMQNLEGADGLETWYAPEPSHRHDRWILSRLNRTAEQVERFMGEYNFGEAQRAIHDFMWHEFADWYIELAKIRMRSDEEEGDSPLPTLAYVLERILRLLHPFLPFVTEELWQLLTRLLPDEPGRPDMLIAATYPEAEESRFDADAEAEMGAVIEIVRAVRNLRAEFKIQPSRQVAATVEAGPLEDALSRESVAIAALGRIEPLSVARESGGEEPDTVSLVLERATVRVPLGGLIDVGQERERLVEEQRQLDGQVAKLSQLLANQNFLSRAPEEVVERERERRRTIEERQARVADILEKLATG